ncbi:MAG TPA: hypothetical protein VKA57_01970 [Solirubrobacteraceae bacterium]|nr:hypothetical protein [Solirubrobacteraceae bacterium]
MSDQNEIPAHVALGATADDDEAIDLLGEDEPDLDDELLDFDGGVVVEQFVPDEIEVGDTDRPVAEIGDDDLPDDEPLFDALPSTFADERLARVEAAARALAQAEVTREQGRIRRKVSAASTGAGAIGFAPILLQLIGALHLSPELAATASTGAAILGALAAGWLTPERESVVAPAAHELLDLGGPS